MVSKESNVGAPFRPMGGIKREPVPKTIPVFHIVVKNETRKRKGVRLKFHALIMCRLVFSQEQFNFNYNSI
jgi:hypothetical protein